MFNDTDSKSKWVNILNTGHVVRKDCFVVLTASRFSYVKVRFQKMTSNIATTETKEHQGQF